MKYVTQRLCLCIGLLGLCSLPLLTGCSASHSHYLEPEQVSFNPQLVWERQNDDRRPLPVNIYWEPDAALIVDERSLFYPPYLAIVFL